MESALMYLGGEAAGTAAVAEGATLAGEAMTSAEALASANTLADSIAAASSWTTGQTLFAGATGLSLLGQVGGAMARADAASANARAAKQNAELALSDAELAGFRSIQQSKEQALVLRQKQRRAQSARVAEIGASGLDMEGSALRVVEGADFVGESEIGKVLAGGTIAANNSLLRGQRAAAAYLGQASQDEARSTSELFGGAFGAGSTLLRYGARRYGTSSGDPLSMRDYAW